MEIDSVAVTEALTCLDPELLQLPELSPFAPQIADDLFSQWLSLPQTNRLVKTLIDEVASGVSVGGAHGSSLSANAAGINSLPSMFQAGSTPPLSPRSSLSGSPRFSKPKTSPSSLGSPLKVVSEPVKEAIPQFYFQNGRSPPNGLKEQCLAKIDEIFGSHMDGMQVQEFKAVTKEVCKLPSFLSPAIFGKIDSGGSGIVTSC